MGYDLDCDRHPPALPPYSSRDRYPPSKGDIILILQQAPVSGNHRF
jgi:hypothetical protein